MKIVMCLKPRFMCEGGYNNSNRGVGEPSSGGNQG